MRIFIASSDATVHLLPITLHQIHKYWPSHPEVVIGGYTPPTFTLPEWAVFHSIGKFSDYPVHRWSNGVIEFIQAMGDDIFLWHMDDFIPIRPINDDVIQLCLRVITSNPVIPRIDLTDDRHLSGGDTTEGKLAYADKWGYVQYVELISTSPQTPYQLSLQSGLWRTEAFLKYVIPNETPAESEIIGSSRMTRDGVTVYGTRQSPMAYLIGTQHGKTVFPDYGYQSPDTRLLPEDRAELERLGYLTKP